MSGVRASERASRRARKAAPVAMAARWGEVTHAARKFALQSRRVPMPATEQRLWSQRMPAAAVAASDLSAGEEVELRNELVHPG